MCYLLASTPTGASVLVEGLTGYFFFYFTTEVCKFSNEFEKLFHENIVVSFLQVTNVCLYVQLEAFLK